MILTIFNRFIKDNSGSIEIIESTLIYPFIMLSISFLFIISVITFSKTIVIENIYSSNRNLIVNFSTDEFITKIDKEDIKNEEGGLNNKILKFTDNKAYIYDESNIFNIKIATNIDEKEYISSKYKLSDTARNVDFVRDIFKNNNIDVEKFSVKEAVYSLQDTLKQFLSRIR
ncbi:hypothetical protein [Helcococcus sueciensis]|uniref:hypothetical protein n=1 Tax=Helcococcus sueciensis TaxID=241555 RepID=UPI00040F4676|nr:hypothetical protein [Helcococcus sueciensis]